jgi:hypothetical protein
MQGARGEIVIMKLLFWILLGLGVTGVAFWMVISPWFPKNPLLEDLAIVFFMAPSVGAFWMLYMVIRHEKRPMPLVLLAFIPYTFLWYYFERIRSRNVQRQVT